MLTHNGILFDLAVHFAALVLVTAKPPSPTTFIRNGVVIPPPAPGMMQYPDESTHVDIDKDLTAAMEPPNRDDLQESRGFKYGEMSEKQAGTLYGKRILVRLRIVEEITGLDRRTAYRCKGNEVADRFVQFGDAKTIDRSLTDGRELMVEATLLMESELKGGYRAQFLLTEARIVGR
jgi:hypothetical protein